MKRIRYLFIIAIVLFIGLMLPITGAAKSNKKIRTRAINIVYDDSGSMVRDDDIYNSRWCQAKYALEVFAAMMGKGDTLTIYPMSSYSDYKGKESSTWHDTYKLKGTDSVESRIDTIDKMNGADGGYLNTPIGTVKAAGDALKKAKSDEKWLIIITDGAFGSKTGKEYTGEEFTEKVKKPIKSFVDDPSIKVAYISIDLENKLGIKSGDFFPYEAAGDDILGTLTQVAQTVYNYMKIDTDKSGSRYSFSPDIPVSKVIVFSQGKNVEVKDLTIDGDKQKITSLGAVKINNKTKIYPKHSPNSDYIYEKLKFVNLNGQVVTYAADDEDVPFKDKALYSFECIDDKETEVYFEPGVDIQAVLLDLEGNEVNLSDDETTSVEAGRKKLHIKIVNPLTGKEIIPSDSKLLKDVGLSMNLQDKNGKVYKYKDGDVVDVPEGEINIYANAVFKDGSEKTTETKSLKVTPAKMKVTFTKDQYIFDPVTVTTSEPVEFTVKASDGNLFSDQEYKNIIFDKIEEKGIKWDISPKKGEKGTYVMTPAYTDEGGIGTLVTDVYNLKVTAHIKQGKIERSGTASAKFGVVLSESVLLDMKMILPEEKVFGTKEKKGLIGRLPKINIGGGDKPYMFDSAIRSVKDDAPYILVEVSVVGSDGKSRPMTEDEWERGVKGFSFRGESVDANILWRFVGFACHQKLDFSVRKGDKPSTYKLYLSGLTQTAVLPNTSDLSVKLNVGLKNGIEEEGRAKDQITVKPASIMAYIGMLLLITILAILAIIIMICEIKKPRLPRSMWPYTTGRLSQNGIPIDPGVPIRNCGGRIKYKVFPPLRAEERNISLSFGNYLPGIYFRVKAEGDGRFSIIDINPFYGVKDDVSFSGASYDSMQQKPRKFHVGSTISIHYDDPWSHTDGVIEMKFSKNKKLFARKKNRKKTVKKTKKSRSRRKYKY